MIDRRHLCLAKQDTWASLHWAGYCNPALRGDLVPEGYLHHFHKLAWRNRTVFKLRGAIALRFRMAQAFPRNRYDGTLFKVADSWLLFPAGALGRVCN